MLDRPATPKPLASPLPELNGYGRDLRIDACRGIALWCIFLNHVPNNVGSWLTLRNYGFSDAAEVFMFLSGLTCALSYGKARQSAGWTGVIGRTLWRSWDIYVAFLLLTLACAVVVHLAGGGTLADRSNTRILLEQPGVTLAHAAILQYRPVNTDILPLFVLYHFLFAPLLWLLLRAPNATLGASLLLYTLVHVFGWTIPAWPTGHWFFNPLAWQLPLVLGAWWIIEGKRFRPWVTSRAALVPAVLYLVFSLVVALSCSIKPLEALVPQPLLTLLYPMDKSNLAPLRLLHFLALAVLAAWFVPRDWRGLTAAVMRGAILCGQNSLPIYCLGVLLTLASHLALLDVSDGLMMQIALSVGGVLVMVAAATLLNLINTKPRQPPHATPADLPVQEATRFELVINLKTAKTLGVKTLGVMPPALLAHAEAGDPLIFRPSYRSQGHDLPPKDPQGSGADRGVRDVCLRSGITIGQPDITYQCHARR
ncbi:OpgC domain-containing protein [Bradyrhizobium sp. SSUT112]|nr:OpgC domain-containing protein [Bradyrhizobium sp. SSUT112]MDH2354172.1 OpgC domain-containing protein [Bradyrhizobium sp. SSUT112]